MPTRSWIAFGCALVGLIFASALTTGAFWRATLPLGAGQVSSGSLVLLNGNAISQVEAYAFTALAGSNLRPGSAAQAPLTMKNGGTTPMGYRLADTTSSGSTTLPGQLTLRIDRVAGESACGTGVDVPPPSGGTTSLYAGALAGATTTGLRPLAPTATETLCVRISVADVAPKSVSGMNAQVRFTFAAVPA